jgi:hypothetical protein
VNSPFLWQQGTLPPISPTETSLLNSEDGADQYVETDCESDGDCTGGDEAHLMVYNASLCGNASWLDTVTGRCRNDTTDPVADALADFESRVSALEALHP